MGDEIEFSAWEVAGHDHREKFRNCGGSKTRTAWLRAERVRLLKAALAQGELLAIGIAKADPFAELAIIPPNIFLSEDLQIDCANSAISGVSRAFDSVKICRLEHFPEIKIDNQKAIGRPNSLAMIINAWNALKIEMHGFLDWDNSAQNQAIREMAAKQNPTKFIKIRRIGESTIRRHRRLRPDLFV